MTDSTRTLIERWKADGDGTYQTWLLWPECLKNSHSIRRSIGAIVNEIQARTLDNTHHGSPLETVISSIAEQRQIFKRADHALLWRLKLCTLDIYENADHQRTFTRLLHTCNCCDTEQRLVQATQQLNQYGIRGLGPIVTSPLYSIRPMLAVPFNIAIVNGHDALTGSRVELEKWDHYLVMRGGVLSLNGRYRDLLSDDLGAVARLLFDIGTGRCPMSPREGDTTTIAEWESNLAKVREEATSFAKQPQTGRTDDASHTEMQGWLHDLGKAPGFTVWVVTNDCSRPYNGGVLSDGCLATLPNSLLVAGADTVPLIDVVWLNTASSEVEAASEIEHTTSIYSGIAQLLDLVSDTEQPAEKRLLLVALDGRRADMYVQLTCPAFSRVSELGTRYVPYTSLIEHRETMAQFGAGIKPIEAITKTLWPVTRLRVPRR